MMNRLVNVLLCIVLNVLVGCAGAQVEPVTYHGWQDAYRLSNGTVDVVVAPSIGRIMRYGYIGEENLLWENPVMAGRNSTTQPGAWGNFGGDKVLPWPQSDWAKRFGHDWPPPSQVDPLLYQVQVLPDNGLLLTSALIEPFGFRVVREIHLANSGTLLTTSTRFEQLTPADPHYPVGVWTVTQWRNPEYILARSATALVPIYGQFKPIEQLAGGVVKMQRQVGKTAKAGFDADVLAVAIGDHLVVQRTHHSPDEHWPNGEQAQVYCNGESGEQSYVELEFTSPRQVLDGGNMELKVDWQAMPIDASRTLSEHLAE